MLKNILPYSVHSGLRGKRRFLCVALGPAKSGTTSLANIFAQNYRSAHEYASTKMIKTLISKPRNDAYKSTPESYSIIKNIDKTGWLEMNSSQLNCFFIDDYKKLVRQPLRFIILCRPVRSWLKSYLNHCIEFKYDKTFPDKCYWEKYTEFRFQGIQINDFEDKRMSHLGLYSLSSYLLFYKEVYENIFNKASLQHCMVIETKNLSKQSSQIADFLDLAHDSLDMRQIRSNARRNKDNFNHINLSKDFIEESIANVFGTNNTPSTAEEFIRYFTN